jgi:hypothetical protein
MAIGWLESGHKFPTGNVNSSLREKLVSLRDEFVESKFPGTSFRGLHVCSLCKEGKNLSESHINLFVPTRGFVYVAPGRIDHYIEAHRYSPPEHFVDAVIQCPSPASVEYRQLMSAANRGHDAPLFGGVAQ